MDPVTFILAAIAAGATAGVSDTVSQAVRDGYAGLKDLVTAKFADNPKAIQALADYESDPETYEKPLAKQLKETGADKDNAIQAASESVLTAADQAGLKTRYQIMVTGGKVGIIGDHGNVTMN